MVKNILCLIVAVLYLHETIFCIASKQEIILGQSANFSGPLKIYSEHIKTGIELYCSYINAHGGINGKQLQLMTLNDQGNPALAKKNLARLKKCGASVFLGNTGTRSILKSLPQIESGEITMLFPWSGSPTLRNTKLKYIINGSGLLDAQINQLIHVIETNMLHKKIAIFHADDEFSTEAALYAQRLIKDQLKSNTISTESYNRFTFDINKCADKIIEKDPKIVLCISTSMPAVKLINRFFEKGHYGTIFFGIDSTYMVPHILAQKGINFTYSSVIENPKTSNLPLAQAYRDALKLYGPKNLLNVLSFEYYLYTAIIVKAMKQINYDKNQNNTHLINAIEAMKNTNVEGFLITFDSANRHASGSSISIIKE
jgi:ABC-type branched-subunit amino acid transport system substrate-binding protein